jgi:hypothetical protein
MYLLIDIIGGEIYDYEIEGIDFETALRNKLKEDPDYFGLKNMAVYEVYDPLNEHIKKIKEMCIYEINFRSRKVSRFHL